MVILVCFKQIGYPKKWIQNNKGLAAGSKNCFVSNIICNKILMQSVCFLENYTLFLDLPFIFVILLQ